VTNATWRDRDGELEFSIEADGFLRGMVRGIVGTQVRVGRGKLPAQEFGDIVAAADRERGGPSAPAQGLCLMMVSYDGGNSEQARRDDEEDE
jgi:tRNA pseudouridine38-40 synthase